ncbi:hypothetical protein VitviT2T_010496 [Vitis vinifera]|uniref:FAR1 domain-containing protein n=1 Tax=Vitis vinifera TaxID=29760 RepID=A0ABY9C8P7_VITVI|nr:hypothetical protein VitviT2T_010496 [Vitis vinifera]
MASTDVADAEAGARASSRVADAKKKERIKRDLTEGITGSWESVVKIYEEHPEAHTMKISKLENTALHIAVESRRGDTVEQLVEQITKSTTEKPEDVLSKENERGNTPLHWAASLGNIEMCKCITGEYKQLLRKRNKESETPLFLAVRHGKKDAFLWLYKEFEDDTKAHECCGIEGGGTVLYCAIEGGYMDLAFQIIQMDENPNLKAKHLMDYLDNEKSTLHLLDEKPTAFRSGIHLGLFKKIIYNCIFVEELIPETSLESPQHPKNYQTCINFFQKPWQMIKLLGKNKNHSDAENPTEGQDQRSPSYICPWLRFIKLVISKAILLVIRLRIAGSSEIRKVKEKKEMHIRSRQIMDKLLKRAKSYYEQEEKLNKWLSQYHEDKATSNGNSSCHSEYEYFRRGHGPSTPILIAASNGIVEMVEKTLQDLPLTIHDRDFKRKNIVLLAVENRQSHLYDFLLKSSHLRDEDLALHAVDEDGNSALHLAAELKNYESWLIPSSTLPMHWEVIWYEYVKKSLRLNVSASSNRIQKTPDQIFTETHKRTLRKKQRMAQQHMQFLLFHCSSNSNGWFALNAQTILDCVDSKSIETSNREMLDLYDDEDDDENDREFIVNELDGTVDPYVGMEFESEEAAMVYYDAYAKRVGFIIRVGNCHRSGRDGSVISRRFLCNKEGFRVSNKKMKRLEVRKPREITREGCRAMIMVRKDKSGKWIVTKLETEHCHPLGIPTGKGRRGSVQARPQVSLLLYSVFSAV